jgi:group I intron endonuclease
MANYSNTFIYQIVCKDKSITDSYVGHSTNLDERLKNHIQNTNPNHCKSNIKLYAFIRENGGWDNWEMKILDHFPNCKNIQEATVREQEWIQKINPILNDKRASITDEEKREKKNEYKRNSERHHEYSREYSKNRTQEQKDEKNRKAREARSNRTPEQIKADQDKDKIRRPRKE